MLEVVFIVGVVGEIDDTGDPGMDAPAVELKALSLRSCADRVDKDRTRLVTPLELPTPDREEMADTDESEDIVLSDLLGETRPS